jgi:hypothetical protein
MDTSTPEKASKPVVSVKMPIDMRDWLQRTAKQGYRSVNAQVLLILDAARKQEALRENA